jgi:Ferredoxin-like domain in Api92-like protein
MPNHVTNKNVSTQDLTPFISDNKFDFAKIIPMPSNLIGLGDVPCHVEDLAKIAAGQPIDVPCKVTLSSISDKDFELYIRYLRNFRKAGTISNLDWQIEFWGTKWNAYDLNQTSETEISFNTAWSAPHPVIEALAKRTGALTHWWADENIGRNVGKRIYLDDGTFTETLLDETREGYELAFLLGADPSYYRFNGITYEYFDPDDD